jgi:integrase
MVERNPIHLAYLVGDPKTAKSKAPVPVIPQLALKLEEHRKRCGGKKTDPIFANSVGHPLDLNACYQKDMKDLLKRAGISWHGWHGFRRGLTTNLNRLGVDDSVIQRILRHSTWRPRRITTSRLHRQMQLQQ